MSVDENTSHVNRLLLNPVFLLHDILGAVIPGGLFLLLLGFKANVTVTHIWFGLPFGYKTNIAIALVFSFLVGKVFQIPGYLMVLVKSNPQQTPEGMKHIPEELRKMVIGALTEGVLSATPEVKDKMAVQQAEGAFYGGTGVALIIASAFQGDGSFRWLELVLGVVFIVVCGAIRHLQQKSILANLGIGFATVISRMNKEQVQLVNALFKAINAKGTTAVSDTEVPTKVMEATSLSSGPVAEA